MFAVVVPGRLVQQSIQTEIPERFIVQLLNPESLNHLCIFLTLPFPENFGATIHLLMPGKEWSLIGGLSNLKPSAIFQLRGKFTPSNSSSNGFTTTLANGEATLGILCEPLSSVELQLSTLNKQPSSSSSSSSNVNNSTSTELVLVRPSQSNLTLNSTIELAQKIALNCFTYLGGFAVMAPDNKNYVSIEVVEKWYKSFESKIRNNNGIGFLMNSD